MNKITKLNLIPILAFTACSVVAQTCKLESEVPSTTPNSRFIDNANGTITDNGTSLMWQKCQLGLSGDSCTSGSATNHNWQQALDEADSNTLAGHNDWRLPNHKELLSIIEQRCHNPSINTAYFPNTSSANFWSSSPYVNNASHAWSVYFIDGYSDHFNDRNVSHFVRLVRFGQ